MLTKITKKNAAALSGDDFDNERAVQKIIGYKFKNILLLRRALTHNSYLAREAEQMRAVGDYQRLEFLGDALLDFVVSEEIFKEHPNYDEGMLTKLRASIVSKTPLAKAVDKTGLTNYIYCEAALSDKMKSDIFESLTASIYLDSGNIKQAKAFIMMMLGNAIIHTRVSDVIDYKSKIFEHCAARRLEIKFNLLKTEGDAHKLQFTYELTLDGLEYAVETGSTKREAQQKCSKVALEKLGVIGIKSGGERNEQR